MCSFAPCFSAKHCICENPMNPWIIHLKCISSLYFYCYICIVLYFVSIPQFTYPLSYWWTFDCFQNFVVKNSLALHTFCTCFSCTYARISQKHSKFPTWGCMRGRVGKILLPGVGSMEILLVVTIGRMLLSFSGASHGAARLPTMYKIAFLSPHPQQRIIWPKITLVLRLRKFSLGVYSCSNLLLPNCSLVWLYQFSSLQQLLEVPIAPDRFQYPVLPDFEIFHRSGGCEVISHCGFKFHFPSLLVWLSISFS